MFAAVYIPDFPLEAVLRSEPALREEAVALLDGKPPVLTVLVANEKARAAGVEAGMTELQAATAGVVLRRRSAVQETAAHAALLDSAQAFSPHVEDTAADTMVLDLAGLELLFGPPAKIVRDLGRRAGELGLETNVAVAANPDAAVLAARGFPGITVIPEGNEAQRLGELPVEVLLKDQGEEGDTAEPLIAALDRWGVRTFRALAALPEVAVTERLGQQGLRLQRLARGATARPLVPASEPLHFEEALELEHPVEMLEPLAFILGRLLEQLCARLAARALATNQLRLRMELDGAVDGGSGFEFQVSRETGSQHKGREGTRSNRTDTGGTDAESETRNAKRETSFERVLRLPVSMLDSRIFLKLLQLDLRAHPPAAPVVKVTLAAEPLRPRQAQGGLFLPVAPEPEKLELVLARIAGVLRGAGRVGSAELLDTHRPDAFRMRHFSPPDDGEDTQDEQRGVLGFRRFRPLRQAAVQTRDGRPCRIRSDDGTLAGEVVSCSGPWRTSGNWWNGIEESPAAAPDGQSGWLRDEWDIAVAGSAGTVLYRVHRDLVTGKWYVEGAYD